MLKLLKSLEKEEKRLKINSLQKFRKWMRILQSSFNLITTEKKYAELTQRLLPSTAKMDSQKP